MGVWVGGGTFINGDLLPKSRVERKQRKSKLQTVSPFLDKKGNGDDCWGLIVPFGNFSAVSGQPHAGILVQSMIESMGMETTEPDQLRQ